MYIWSWSSWSYMFIFAWIFAHLVVFFLDTVLYLINSPFSKYFKMWYFSNKHTASYTSRPASRNETNEAFKCLWFPLVYPFFFSNLWGLSLRLNAGLKTRSDFWKRVFNLHILTTVAMGCLDEPQLVKVVSWKWAIWSRDGPRPT